MILTFQVATVNTTQEQKEKLILKELKVEKVKAGSRIFFIYIPEAKLYPTLECYLRDKLRFVKRAISRLKFYKEDFFELDKSEKESVKHIIECYKCKASQLQNFLYQLKLDKKPKISKRKKHGKSKN